MAELLPYFQKKTFRELQKCKALHNMNQNLSRKQGLSSIPNELGFVYLAGKKVTKNCQWLPICYKDEAD
jgi:hypothetical protein